MPQLTQTDISELSTILGSGDRGRFYYETAHRLRDVITPDAFEQLMIQAQITTYGGVYGGAAQVGNSFGNSGDSILNY